MGREWLIEGLDTLFFRGGQPFNAGESGFVASLFPPTPETLQGLVRALLLRENGLPYDALRRRFDAELQALAQEARLPPDIGLREQLGSASRGQLGQLRLRGPYLELAEQRLYPAPLHLVRISDEDAGNAGGSRLRLLAPAKDPTKTDLGEIRLPSAPGRGLKDVSGHWISADGLGEILQGGPPEAEKHLWRERPPPRASLRRRATDRPHLLGAEPRVGIGRDPGRRAVKEGELYAVEMLRLAHRPGPQAPPEPVRIGVQVLGVDERLQPAAGGHLIRFGGEGRLAEIQVREELPELPAAGDPAAGESGRLQFCLVLLAPALFAEGGWLPDAGERRSDGSLWQGDLPFVTAEGEDRSLRVSIVSACVARPARIGGWELGGTSRPLRSFVPAGAVYFCETEPESRETLKELHGGHIGAASCMGYGWCAVGAWPRAEPV